VTTSRRSVLQQCGLPLKIDIYACQHYDVEGLTLSQEGQVAQLSQRDRAAGWLSFGQKW